MTNQMDALNAYEIEPVSMIDLDAISGEAEEVGVSEREYCLMQIRLLKEHLYATSEDYRTLEQSEFELRIEKEVDEYEVS